MGTSPSLAPASCRIEGGCAVPEVSQYTCRSAATRSDPSVAVDVAQQGLVVAWLESPHPPQSGRSRLLDSENQVPVDGATRTTSDTPSP
jgi:hypothetical protein